MVWQSDLFINASDPLRQVGEGVEGKVVDGFLDLGQDLTERGGVVPTCLQRTDLQVDFLLHGQQIIDLKRKRISSLI